MQIVVRTHQDLRRLQLLRPVVQARLQLMRVSHKSVVQGARPHYLLSSASHVFRNVKPLQEDLIQTTAKVCMDINNNLGALGLPNHGTDIGRETNSQRVVERRHEIARLEWMGGVNE